ncbi:hypothetical protein QWZ03_18545 [Chitinimonas viridis]|uniref:DUF418 domain-containing protein n=1 Tax=Chitinimonas viridis TaxID=664880 RepID=A0ABT8BAE1_9NEIS|nr:hypothetical protein [Chitinimonas viridis]MDN3578770.1 hypothetical protein [Chitinimonas viridis]
MTDTLRDYERAGVANNFGLLRLLAANLVWLPLIGTLVLACLSWNLVEKPAQRFKNQPWQGWLKRGWLAWKPTLSPGK